MSDAGTEMVDIPTELENELTEMISVHTICRLCANQSGKLIGIYSEDGLNNDLANKMNLYLPIKVSEIDTLPLQCCWQCASTVLAWHDLVITSTEADKRLRSYQMTTEKQLQDVTSYKMSDAEISREGSLDTSTLSKEPHLFDNINDERSLCNESNLKLVANSMENEEDEICTSEYLDLELENNAAYISVRKDILDNKIKSQAVEIKQDCEISDLDDEYDLECPLCSNTFSSERDISQHIKHNHSDVQKGDDLFFQVKNIDGDTKTDFKAKKKPKVSRRFNVKHMMNKPQQKIDQELVNKAKLVVDGRVFYKCKECGKSLHSMYTYVWHMRIHTGERPYVCDLCGKQFRVSQGLVRHLKETHERIKNFECDICGRYFFSKRNVEEHRRIHTNERPYVCALCGKSFKQKASLFVHNRSHSSEFPFNCTYCPQKFRTKQSLLTHITRHTGEKPFPCEVCGRRFRIKYELKRHTLVHSEDKPFSCKMCGQTFRQKRYLRNHLKLNHHVTNPNELIDL